MKPDFPLPAPTRDAARVLVVDDVEPLLDVARRQLEELGYVVRCFTSPVEALGAIRADPASVDVVITDLTMPVMGGLELARAIAEIRPDLPVVLASGNRTQSDAELAEANVWLELPKPYSYASLSEVVARAIQIGATPRPRS